MRVDKNPPFAFMIYEGESRCTQHLPSPAIPINSLQEQAVPAEFGAFTPEPEKIETDNRFVVDEGASTKPAKKAPQQRKRTAKTVES
jgi:hypothetical protein